MKKKGTSIKLKHSLEAKEYSNYIEDIEKIYRRENIVISTKPIKAFTPTTIMLCREGVNIDRKCVYAELIHFCKQGSFIRYYEKTE